MSEPTETASRPAEPSTRRSGDGSARRVSLAAALLAASVLLSRALGLVRDGVLAAKVGDSAAADAYNAAFQIPDILNYFLAGGALAIAFVPLYTSARAREGPAAAEALFHKVLGTLGVAVVVATAGLWWWVDELIAFQFPRLEPEVRALTADLTRIVLPAQVFFVVGGVIRAVLMAHGRFWAQAFAPLLYNLGIILGGVLLAPSLGIAGFAWGALGGAFLGPFAAAVIELRGRVRLGARFAPFDRDVIIYLGIAAPLMAGVTLLTVDEWYDRWFGQLGPEGTIAVLGYARRLMQVPVAVVGQALATAALPTLARLWSENRREELDGLVLGTLKAGVAIGVLGGAATWVLADPLVTIVYRRGAFDAAAAERVVATLRIFAFAVPAWIAQQIAVRPFYARGDTWRPMLLGTAVAAAAIPLYLRLSELGPTGLAAAGAIAISLNSVATLLLARRVHGAPHLGELSWSIARVLAAAVLAAAAAEFVRPGGAGLGGAFVDLALGGGVFLGVATAGVLVFADAAARDAWLGLLRGLVRRLRGRASG